MQAAENTQESDTAAIPGKVDISPEDLTRAQIYRMLAAFLSRPPDNGSLQVARQLSGDESEFGQAISDFAALAGKFDTERADTEYHDLFIGVTRGELLPYGSYYQTGFLNEKPLARLRTDMTRLGIVRAEGLKDPEDHVAALLEMMAGLIDGSYGRPLTLKQQKNFFETHMLSWMPHFFADLEAAKNSVLYAPLGKVGRLFMEIERTSLSMI